MTGPRRRRATHVSATARHPPPGSTRPTPESVPGLGRNGHDRRGRHRAGDRRAGARGPARHPGAGVRRRAGGLRGGTREGESASRTAAHPRPLPPKERGAVSPGVALWHRSVCVVSEQRALGVAAGIDAVLLTPGTSATRGARPGRAAARPVSLSSLSLLARPPPGRTLARSRTRRCSTRRSCSSSTAAWAQAWASTSPRCALASLRESFCSCFSRGPALARSSPRRFSRSAPLVFVPRRAARAR